MRNSRIAHAALVAIALAVTAPASAGEFQPVSMDAVTAAVKADRPIVFHVRTQNGPLCQAQHAVLEKLMAEPDFENYLVLQVDFFEDERAVKMLGAELPGSILLGRGGSEIARLQGNTDEDSIRTFRVQPQQGCSPSFARVHNRNSLAHGVYIVTGQIPPVAEVSIHADDAVVGVALVSFRAPNFVLCAAPSNCWRICCDQTTMARTEVIFCTSIRGISCQSASTQHILWRHYRCYFRTYR